MSRAFIPLGRDSESSAFFCWQPYTRIIVFFSQLETKTLFLLECLVVCIASTTLPTWKHGRLEKTALLVCSGAFSGLGFTHAACHLSRKPNFSPFLLSFQSLRVSPSTYNIFVWLVVRQVNYLTRMQVHKFRRNGAWSNLRCTMCQFLDICSLISSVFSILFLGRSWIQVDTLYFWQ